MVVCFCNNWKRLLFVFLQNANKKLTSFQNNSFPLLILSRVADDAMICFVYTADHSRHDYHHRIPPNTCSQRRCRRCRRRHRRRSRSFHPRRDRDRLLRRSTFCSVAELAANVYNKHNCRHNKAQRAMRQEKRREQIGKRIVARSTRAAHQNDRRLALKINVIVVLLLIICNAYFDIKDPYDSTDKRIIAARLL